MRGGGTVNADGFGAGWWDRRRRPEPARYRRAVPMWTDRNFTSVAALVESGAVVAAVRSATPPLPVEESGTPPFTSGRWLFAHNGVVQGWNDGAGVRFRRELSERRAAGLEGPSDSEALFASTLDHLDAGRAPGEALAAVVRRAAAAYGGRFNLLLAEGTTIAATAWGDTLWAHRSDEGVVVASEPHDDLTWEPSPTARWWRPTSSTCASPRSTTDPLWRDRCP